MDIEKQTYKNYLESKRVFKIKRVKNRICLSDSFSMVNNEASEKLFEAEIFKVTFSSNIADNIKSYDLFLAKNELIPDQEITALKDSLGIEIFGDGTCIEIINFQTDFSIQFDQENSSFIDSEQVKNGYIMFKK